MPVASPTPHAHTAAPGLSSRAGLAPDLLIAPTASTTAGPHAAQTPMARVQQASRETFADVLAQQGRGPAAKPPKQMNEAELDERARKTAEDFVAIAFVQPILKGLRSSTLADLAPPLGPGPGEKQFRSIADAQTARS
ncbi:MAG: hypothetical protein K2Q09_10985, partial [Phycisphaerales bacterium]|nr:hypothetical protein [Phycisphaerales bacterium]